MGFKKGDIIVGNSKSTQEYSVTNEFCTMEVLADEENGRIEVEIINHEIDTDFIGDQEEVYSKYFVLKSAPKAKNGVTYLSKIGIPICKIEIKDSKIRTLKAKGLI